LDFAERVWKELGDLGGFFDSSQQSWYKFENEREVHIVKQRAQGAKSISYLSRYSAVVNGLKPVNQVRVYVSEENRKEATARLGSLLRNPKEA
jgi:hypothetical protein